jgi:formamidopyrimidine-DNA glycosylase
MPELPEVETVRRGLQPVMEGAKILKAEARRKDLRFPFQKDFAARLTGQTVTGLGRRAKYLMADLTSGDVLLMHLGMSGSFRVLKGEKSATPANSITRAARTVPTIMWCSTCPQALRSCSTIRAASAI